MRNFTKLVIASALLATQATPTDSSIIAASVQTSVPTVVSSQSHITFATTGVEPVGLKLQEQPNFDTEVLAPLRAAQAAAKAREAATKVQIRKVVTTVKAVARGIAPATPEHMQALRLCESGNTYTRNSGNGYFGAYQYNNGTWAGYGGYARADLAPASVQDAKFLATYGARGWSPWPACSRKLGLM
jgi:hypothetical protein